MIYAFYHSEDLDGHCSGAIVKFFYNQIGKEVTLIPFNYNNEIKITFQKEDIVYFTDVVPNPFNRLYEIEKDVSKVIIFDHHKSFIESPEGQYFSQRNHNKLQTDFSGCQLTWQGLFPAERKTPVIVTLLGEYDRWNDSDTIMWSSQILPFQFGIRLDKTDPVDNFDYWNTWFSMKLPWARVQDVITKGCTVLRYQDLQNERIMTSSFEHTIVLIKEEIEYKCLCVNATFRNSDLFKSKWDATKYNFMVVYSEVKKGLWGFSAYTTRDDMDASMFAKQFGGGGHKKAAGWILKDLKDFFV